MSRERTALIAVALVAILGAVWLLVVSPERKQANQLSAQVIAAKSQLASAESKEASARTAQSQYATAYAAVVSLGKAVPASDEVPALIDQLTQASNQKNVDFNSITSGGSGSSGTSASAAAASASSALPFTFAFEGSYFALEHLMRQLADFAKLTPKGTIRVSGRLLTIQSVKLAPSGSLTSPNKLTGTVTATAYTMPATASPTLTSPTGSSSPASSTTSAASSPTAPATVTVNP
jgi:Tfp pilus assembly protein PilO